MKPEDPDILRTWQQADKVPDIELTKAILNERYRPFEPTGVLVPCPCCGEPIDEAGLKFMQQEPDL